METAHTGRRLRAGAIAGSASLLAIGLSALATVHHPYAGPGLGLGVAAGIGRLRRRPALIGHLILAACCLTSVALLYSRGRAAVLVVLAVVVTHTVRLREGAPASGTQRRLVIAVYVGVTLIAVTLWLLSITAPALTWILVAGAAGSLIVAVATPLLPSAPVSRVRRGRWLTWALLAGAGLAATAVVVSVVGGWPVQWAWIGGLAAALFPLALLAAQVPGTDRVLPPLLHGAVILASLSAAVLTVVGVAVLALGNVPDARQRHVLAWAAVGAVIAAVSYEPARRALIARAIRAVYRGRPRPDRLGATIAGGLSRAVPLEDTLQYVAECAGTALELAQVSVWLEAGQRLERVASHPQLPRRTVGAPDAPLAGLASEGARGPAWLKTWIPELLAAGDDRDARLVPITATGELLGALLAEPSPAGAQLTLAQERALRELAVQLGPVLRNARLDSALSASAIALREHARELRESRARVVSAADAERRRLERDLHDGAQQHLVALIFNLRAAARLVRSDPERAVGLLAHLERASSDALDDLRALSQGIYPAVLSASGVGPALEAAAARLSLAAYVDVSLAGRPPLEVEGAIYFVCLEAMQNAAKHAGSGVTVRVRVEQREQAILVEVSDDGRGFDGGRAAERTGLINIRDRIGALGGAVAVNSRPGGGTRVAASVPVSVTAAPRPRVPVRTGTAAPL